MPAFLGMEPILKIRLIMSCGAFGAQDEGSERPKPAAGAATSKSRPVWLGARGQLCRTPSRMPILRKTEEPLVVVIPRSRARGKATRTEPAAQKTGRENPNEKGVDNTAQNLYIILQRLKHNCA